MTRIFATTAFLICLSVSISFPAYSQANSGTDSGCFPWQEFRNGQCVAKPTNSPPPPPPAAPAPAVAPPAVTPPAPPEPPSSAASPCLEGSFRNSAGQCTCPTGMHADTANGRCAGDSAVQRPQNTVCDGGTLSNGTCICPSSFNLMRAAGNAAGGTCVRTDAENCQGGELTVSGHCMCNGQVIMSGETYLLEYSNGKCLPMSCPVGAMKDGKCGETAAATPTAEPETKPRPAPKETSETRRHSEANEHRRHCGHGMVLTRVGCVPAERRLNDLHHRYYRNYQFPGVASPD